MGKLANRFFVSSKGLIHGFNNLPGMIEPKLINDFVKKCDKLDEFVEPPTDICKLAKNHFNREYKYYQQNGANYARTFLSPQEEKYLPFVMKDICKDSKQLYFAYIIISHNKTGLMLKNEIQSYFSCYKEKYAAVLAQDILNKLATYAGKNSRLKSYKRYNYIFKTDGFEKIYNYCCKYGFENYLDKIRLSGVLRYSAMVNDVLSKMFAADDSVLTVKKKYNLYNSVILRSMDEKLYYGIYDDIFSHFIISVDRYKKSEIKDDIINNLRNELVRFYGDPRLSPRNWRGVKKESLKIFKRWLSQRDLKLFFQIISDSYGNADFSAKKMWAYRKSFWEAYLPHISNTWVLFGTEAEEQIPKSEVMEYGHFSNSKKSCIMMQIGRCTFIERSHNGKLKVWIYKCPFDIGVKKIEERELVNRIADDEWRHTNPENYNWQKNVSYFIMKNCKIVKDIKEFEQGHY